MNFTTHTPAVRQMTQILGQRRPRRTLRPGPAFRHAATRDVFFIDHAGGWKAGGLNGLGGESLLDLATGGAPTKISKQLDKVELALKVSTGAALFAGAVGLVQLLFGGRR